MKQSLLPLLVLLSAAHQVRAEAPKDEIRFNRDIRPILSNRCFKCHGPDLKKGGLDLQNRDAALKKLGSDSTAIVPGKSGASELMARINASEPSERMPPKGDPLTPQQIEILKKWIDQGAKYEEHWSYVKPTKPTLPAVKNQAWVRNPIDAFVLARLESEGLKPTAEAEKTTLLRRASLDLTGLPPTLEELDQFLNDKSPEAYEKAVDRLLASPHYGEHQARYWLDVARYADTNGYEKDERRTIWPYRDWVIDAFNRDLPFDQFTIEQLAGDLLPNPTQQQLIATGFHRNTMVNTEGGTDDEEFRTAAVIDRVNATMEIWMGATLACAQCHNHKYDPFTQKEYYRLFAFLNSTEDRGRGNDPILPLYSEEQKAKLDAIKTRLEGLKKLTGAPTALFGLVGQRGIQQQVRKGQKEQTELKATKTTLVLRELPSPRTTKVMIRGNFKNLGEAVTPGTPAKLHPFRPEWPANRLGLAKWLVDADNPLTSRVIVNRIWARYFGRGFVETSEEFGTQGDLPTHPELLDWLATEFVEGKWSVKALHKRIVTSATYRQGSKVTPDLHQRDPFNRLFARGPRLRLDAETVRDNALAISGLLYRKIGGPSVFPYQPDGVWFNPYSGDRWVVSTNGDEHRRGLYTFWRRTAPYAAFMAFDAPSREICTERRPRTNTPLQALATLNDHVFVEASAALARRLLKESAETEARINLGFRLCVARTPTAKERVVLLALFRENLEKYTKDAKAAQALAKNGGLVLPQGTSAAEVAAWTVIANVLLNLDETITKG